QDRRPPQDRRPQDRPRGDRPRDERPRDDRPRGDHPRDDRPRGDRPPQDRSRGDRPRDERPGAERRQPGGRPAERRDDRRPPPERRQRDDRRGPPAERPAPARDGDRDRAASPSPAAAPQSADEATTTLQRPAAALDSGWGLPDEPAAADSAAAAEVARTPTVQPPPDPRDPDGDDLFVDLSDDAVKPGTLTNVAGIKFRDAGTIHEYDAGDASYARGDRVMVETDRGPLPATVAIASRRMPSLDPLRRILRPATDADARAQEKNAGREREAYVFCRQRIRERGLPMKMVRVEYPLQSGKVLFYFSSE